MFTKIYNIYRNFEKITIKILNIGLKFCFVLCLFSVMFLLTYILFIQAPILFYIGISIFKFSLILVTEFIVCSFVVDGIKKQLI